MTRREQLAALDALTVDLRDRTNRLDRQVRALAADPLGLRKDRRTS